MSAMSVSHVYRVTPSRPHRPRLSHVVRLIFALASPRLALPCLALPCWFVWPCVALSCWLVWPCLALSFSGWVPAVGWEVMFLFCVLLSFLLSVLSVGRSGCLHPVPSGLVLSWPRATSSTTQSAVAVLSRYLS